MQLVVALKPLHDLFNIKRIVTSTYQSVSGAGKEPMDELIEQTKQFLNKETIHPKNLLSKLLSMLFRISMFSLMMDIQKKN